ncbi:MAG TPA: START domain-containing protein [Fibrella sp.]
MSGSKLVCTLWLVLPWVSSLGSSSAEAQLRDNWHLEKDKNGIQVYSRHLADTRLKEIKVHCEMAGYPAQLVAFFTDVDQYSQVLYKNKKARLLRRVSETELYYYAESEMPWPAANRDVVIRLRFAYDPKVRALQITTTAEPDLVPLQEGIVRVPVWQASWLVQSLSESSMVVDYTFQVDPGGKLPAWLINATAAIGPYQSFVNMREKIQLPRYQGRSFRFMATAN